MSIKRMLMLAAAGAASVASIGALAGTAMPVTAAAPTTITSTPDRGIYVEGLAGYDRYGVENAYVTKADQSSFDFKNGNGNFAFGVDAGYQINKYFSAEASGIYVLPAKATIKGTKAESDYKTYAAYVAGKISVPVYENFSVFTKLGVGYQHLTIDNKNYPTGSHVPAKQTGSKVGPMFGAGVAYNITPAIYVSGEWLRFNGQTKMHEPSDTAKTNMVSTPNIFLVGVGYKFAL